MELQVSEKKFQGQQEDINKRCYCQRCNRKMASTNFYSYKDGSKCQICKPCLTAHIDNFDSSTFEWILEKMDVPYIPAQWNNVRDKAFAKDPYKMNGMSVIGKYLGKMKLIQYNKYGYADSAKAIQELGQKTQKKLKKQKKEKQKFQEQMKQQFEQGNISEAQYKTLVSTQTQNVDLPQQWGDAITGEHLGEQIGFSIDTKVQPKSYEEALNQIRNPYQQKNFIAQEELPDPAADLQKEDKIYLALKWGRLYTPSQWVALEQLYNEFMNSFAIQGAARIDTLKMICKTSLKMNQAIDMGDVESYQKLSRVYDSMMKSAKFTQAQNKDSESAGIDSVSALVDFVEEHTGAIPRYVCKQPKDIVDKIIIDLKDYTRSLIYQDKSLAQQIERYLQDKKILEEMKKDKAEAKKKNKKYVELTDEDIIKYKESLEYMRQQDQEMIQKGEEIE